MSSAINCNIPNSESAHTIAIFGDEGEPSTLLPCVSRQNSFIEESPERGRSRLFTC